MQLLVLWPLPIDKCLVTELETQFFETIDPELYILTSHPCSFQSHSTIVVLYRVLSSIGRFPG